jgi:hypothetical protein
MARPSEAPGLQYVHHRLGGSTPIVTVSAALRSGYFI